MSDSRTPPVTDADLPPFLRNMATQLLSHWQAAGITLDTATTFHSRYETYDTLLAFAKNPDTAGTRATKMKNNAKQEVLQMCRELCRTIGNNMAVSDMLKFDLGLHGRKKPEPRPAPEDQPDIDLLGVGDTWVQIRVHGGRTNTRRRKPAGVMGSEVYVFVGNSPPPNIGDWSSRGISTKPRIRLEFGTDVAPGTRVWVGVRWFNARGAGPFSMPTELTLGGNRLAAAGETPDARNVTRERANETVMRAA